MLHKLAAAATAGVEKTRIRSSELKIGMYVCELDRSWLDSPFLVHGFVIRNQELLEQVQQLCRFVYIDVARGNFSANQSASSVETGATEYHDSCSFKDNLDQAKIRYANAKSTVQSIFDSFSEGEACDLEAVRSSVKLCVENIVANPSSMLWLSMIKHKDEYTAEHSLNVALLSIVLGRAEGLDSDTLETLGLCAMLHDVGKVKVPDEILNKEGNLDEKEFAVMKMHTVHGKKLLLGQAGLPDIATEVALSHHEKIDGTGYPGGLSGDKISYLVRLVAIADAYDAMTSERIYCTAKPPSQALRLLVKSKGAHHDAQLLDRFIECIGIYPTGSLAELNSGEIGIVLPGGPEDKSNDNLKPAVMLVADSDKQPCEPRRIDIGRDRRPDNDRPYTIRAIHEDGKYGLRFEAFSEIALQFIDG